jgi:hypothetical protein
MLDANQAALQTQRRSASPQRRDQTNISAILIIYRRIYLGIH